MQKDSKQFTNKKTLVPLRLERPRNSTKRPLWDYQKQAINDPPSHHLPINGRPFRISWKKIVFQFFLRGPLWKKSVESTNGKIQSQNATSYGEQLKQEEKLHQGALKGTIRGPLMAPSSQTQDTLALLLLGTACRVWKRTKRSCHLFVGKGAAKNPPVCLFPCQMSPVIGVAWPTHNPSSRIKEATIVRRTLAGWRVQ